MFKTVELRHHRRTAGPYLMRANYYSIKEKCQFVINLNGPSLPKKLNPLEGTMLICSNEKCF